MKGAIKQRLEDQFLQNWNSLVHNSPKAINHGTFKTELKYEKYLNILEMKDAILFCTLYNSSQIGDEYNYVFECNYFNKKRKQSLSNYYINRHTTIKLCQVKDNQYWRNSVIS